MTIEVSVDVQATATVAVPSEDSIAEWVSTALAAARLDGQYELAVQVVDEGESRALNHKYRGKDSPTNVLSFPFARMAGMPTAAPRPLGDLVVCGPVVEREAAEQGKAVSDHWAHMVVHGVLHLAGYDHEKDEEATAMESLEAEILQKFEIANPYVRSQ